MKEKDTLVSQTDAQRDPYRAMPEDFVIFTDGQPHFGGQHDARLLAEARKVRSTKSPVTGKGAPRSARPDDAGKPHTDGIDSD